jgi:glutathione S-transferase
MIKVYHSRRARSTRVIWLLEELAVPYEVELLEFKPEALQTPEYLKLHPLGQLPAIRDAAVSMFESGAILQYLLEKHGETRLAPAPGTPPRPEYLQWFHFGEASLANYTSLIVRERFGKGDAEPNEALLAEARKRLRASVAVIDRALEGRAFICGANFSAADIMVSYGIVMARITRELPAEFANVAGYLERLKQRPGYQKAWA